jgi:hypothetical protein
MERNSYGQVINCLTRIDRTFKVASDEVNDSGKVALGGIATSLGFGVLNETG